MSIFSPPCMSAWQERASRPSLKPAPFRFSIGPVWSIFGGICIALVGLIWRALQQGETAATLFLLGFFALMLWQLGGFFKRNLPRRYTLDRIPSDVLPKTN